MRRVYLYQSKTGKQGFTTISAASEKEIDSILKSRTHYVWFKLYVKPQGKQTLTKHSVK